MRGNDVRALQQRLVSLGYLPTDSATGYFGALTRAGVRMFQRDNGIASSGSEPTTGYGAVGPKTRGALASGASVATPFVTNTAPPSGSSSLIDSLLVQLKALQDRIAALNAQPIQTATSTLALCTPLQPQTQTLSCSSGQTGSITQTRTSPCATGATTPTWGEWQTTSNSCTAQVTSSTSCTWNGQTVASGASVTAYQTPSVPFGGQCAVQTRTCSNGNLAGTYQYPACVAQANNTTFAPQDYGAKCDGVTDDSVPLKQWVAAITNAALTYGRAEGIVNGACGTSETIAFPNFRGDLTIKGTQPNAGFTIVGNYHPTQNGVLTIGGAYADGITTTVLNDVSANSTSIVVANTASIAAGTYLAITATATYPNAGGSVARGFFAKVAAVNGTTITLEKAVPFPITVSTDQTTVMSRTLNGGHLEVSGITVRGDHASVDSGGFFFINLVNPTLTNLNTYAIGGNGAGILGQYLYGGTFSHLHDADFGYCGGVPCAGGTGAGIQFSYVTGGMFNDMVTTNSNGVGMMLVAINASDFRSIRTDVSKGRGMEFYGSSGNRADTITSNYSGATGFSVVYGSSYNVFSNVTALHNHHQSLWSNGVGNLYNTYNGVAAHTDAGENITGQDIYIGNLDRGATLTSVNPNYRGIYIQSDTSCTLTNESSCPL